MAARQTMRTYAVILLFRSILVFRTLAAFIMYAYYAVSGIDVTFLLAENMYSCLIGVLVLRVDSRNNKFRSKFDSTHFSDEGGANWANS